MMKNQIHGIGLLAMLLALSLPILGQTAEEHLRRGDEFYENFEDGKALEEYLLALKLEESHYEALWKAARSLIDVADLMSPMEKDVKEKQKKMYREAESYARKAAAVKPDDTWGHFYLSAAMGKRALLLGKKEQIDMSKAIKERIEKAIELDPGNDYAYHALGRWHRRMAEIGGAKRLIGGLLYGGIPKGSFEESEKHLSKAVELRPGYINHHLELGRTYSAMGKNDLAAREFQKCLDLPVATSKDHIYKEEAAAELEKIKK